MLRHFETIDDLTRKKLLSNGYAFSQIQEELLLTGSKFFSHFANNIKQLLEIVLQYPYQKSKGINGNHIIELELPIAVYPNGIGTKAVLSLNEISRHLQDKIFHEKNRNILLAHLLVDELPITHQCTLILMPTHEGYKFISAFPGQSAMPIPDYKMTRAKFSACKTYWDGNVFLKRK